MYDYDFDINDNFTMESDLIKMSKELDEYSNQCNYIITNRHLYQEGVFDSIRRGARNIWEWFKGLLRKLLSVLQWIGRKIRSLFKKDKVSIDQIVASCGIQPKKKHVHEAVAAPPNEETITIHFPASKGSFLSETDLKIAAKNLLIKIENNRFVASVPGIEKNLNFRGPHRTNNWETNYYAACAVITETSISDLFFDIMDKLVFDDTGKLVEIEHGFIHDVDKLDVLAYDDKNVSKYKNGIPFNNRDFTHFQSELASMSSKIDKIQTIEGISDDLLEALNKFADIIIGITFGMNEFNRAVNQLYMIDEQYIAAVNQAQDLDSFVYECIRNGVHPKFIAYNTWLLLDDAWKTDRDTFYTKNIEPMWGQTRTVFYIRRVDVVAKIAMSGAGISSNKNEIVVTKEFKERGVEDLLACVQEYMKHAAVIFPEAIKPYARVTEDDLWVYKDKLEDLYWDYPDLRDIRSDIHIKNIGFNYRNQLVCIDYGNTLIRKG
jgi:hypothetical protein